MIERKEQHFFHTIAGFVVYSVLMWLLNYLK